MLLPVIQGTSLALHAKPNKAKISSVSLYKASNSFRRGPKEKCEEKGSSPYKIFTTLANAS